MCPISNTDNGATSNAELDPKLRSLIPTHPVAEAALKVALKSLSPAVFNHSLRVYIYARALSSEFSKSSSHSTGSSIKPVYIEPHVLFVACLFHDLATSEKYDSDPGRFEVLGADEAVRLLREHNIDEESIRETWLAMSLHTTPGIPDRLTGATGAFRHAIRTEFGRGSTPDVAFADGDEEFLKALPRLEIEKVLGDSVVRQALNNRVKAPAASWPGQLLLSHDENPGWDGVNKAF